MKSFLCSSSSSIEAFDQLVNQINASRLVTILIFKWWSLDFWAAFRDPNKIVNHHRHIIMWEILKIVSSPAFLILLMLCSCWFFFQLFLVIPCQKLCENPQFITHCLAGIIYTLTTTVCYYFPWIFQVGMPRVSDISCVVMCTFGMSIQIVHA